MTEMNIPTEIQKTENCLSSDELDAAMARYRDLYDFAPVGYFTLDSDGVIRDVNLTAATLLGIERYRLLGSKFEILVANKARHIFAEFLEKVLASYGNDSCEIPFDREENIPLIVHLEAVALNGGQECRMAVIDITARKLAEESQHCRNELNLKIVCHR
jgi:PAS domain S-box-containing protein